VDKETEFLEAVKTGKIEQVTELIRDNPALVDARSESGASVVVLAAYYGQPQVASLLVERGAKVDIFEAAMTGSIGRLQEILVAQPELAEAVAPDGFQPLGLASFFGHRSTVELLLGRGVEVNSPSRNEQHVMPLHSAAAGQHLEIARLLLKHGADPNTRQSGGFTALHAAAQNGQVEMVELLIEHAADIEAKSEDGRIPLDFAREGGHERVVRLLTSRLEGKDG
jgi:ankyrin repeat protein